MTFAVLLYGCAFYSEITDSAHSTSTTTTTLTEPSTLPTSTEPAQESYSELTTDRDKTKLCLRFQPTQEVIAGEDVRYYTPSNQSEWISVFEDTLTKADPKEHWEPADSSKGIWICYQYH